MIDEKAVYAQEGLAKPKLAQVASQTDDLLAQQLTLLLPSCSRSPAAPWTPHKARRRKELRH